MLSRMLWGRTKAIAILPVYDEPTRYLNRLLGSYWEQVSEELLQEELASYSRLRSRLDDGARVVFFAGHGNYGALLTASHLGINDESHRNGSELFNKTVAGSVYPIYIFGFCCRAGRILGDEVAAHGGVFLGYREDIGFVTKPEGDALYDVYRDVVKLVGREVASTGHFSRKSYDKVRKFYDSRIRILKKKRDRESRLLRMSLRLQLRSLTYSSNGD